MSLSRLQKISAHLLTKNVISTSNASTTSSRHFTTSTKANMHSAIINAWGEKPKWEEVPDLPTPDSDSMRIKVEAVGIHRVVRSRASGKHYSSGSPPHVPGVDGVGRTEDGKHVYFSTFGKGVLSEYINMPRNGIFVLAQGSDPVQIASGMNPAMSSWMALKARTTDLPSNFTCLILGATSASGRVGIALSKALGAGKVIGAARNKATLDTLGLDRTIVIPSGTEEADFSNLDDIDVVLDYIYGDVTLQLLKALKTSKPVQYIQIGQLASQELELPGQLLRSKDITIRGAGPGSWQMSHFQRTIPELLQRMAKVPEQPVKVAKFADMEKEWDYDGPERLVLVP